MNRVEISPWQPGPSSPALSMGKIHLWRYRLDLPEAEVQTLKLNLSNDELSRAERFINSENQSQFVVARSRMRQILARYLNRDPASLHFQYGTQGKPALLNDPSDLNFNLAHSGKWALLALGLAGSIGVDLEFIDRSIDIYSIANHYLTAEERTRLNSVTEPRKIRVFYRLWTEKESRLKMSGDGISGLPEQLESACVSHLRRLPVAKNYLGAVCFSLELTSIIRYQLS
jgi:4'-phosphopantetheinyl transferase